MYTTQRVVHKVLKWREAREFNRSQTAMNLIEKATAERPFPQVRFMSETWFDSFLRDRGLQLGVTGIRSLVDAGVLQRLNTQSGDFHPFQIWPISSLLKALELRLDVGLANHGFDPAGFKQFIDLNWSHRAEVLVQFPQQHPVD